MMPRVKLTDEEKAQAEDRAKKQARIKSKERYEQRKREGRCVNCGDELPLGWKSVQCQKCRERQKGYEKKKRERDKEKRAAKKAAEKKQLEALRKDLATSSKTIKVKPNLLRRSCEFYVHEGPDGCSALKKRECRGCSFYRKASDL